MASVSIRPRETKGGRHFQVRYRLGGRGYPLVHGGVFPTLKDARTRRDLIAGELAAGRNPVALLQALAEPVAPPTVHTLGERFDAFIASRVDVGAKTLALYRNARDKLGALAGRDPGTLTPADFQSWVAANAASRRGRSPTTSPRSGRYSTSATSSRTRPARRRCGCPPTRCPRSRFPRTTSGSRSSERLRSGYCSRYG